MTKETRDKQLDCLVDKHLSKRIKKQRPQWVNELMSAICIVIGIAIGGMIIDKYSDLSTPSYGFSLSIGCFMGSTVITGKKLTLFRQFLYGIGIISLIAHWLMIIILKA